MHYWIYALVVVTIGGICSCSEKTMPTPEDWAPVNAGNIAKLQQEIGLSFPTDSRVLEFHMPERVVDPVWVAKVAVPRSSWAEFKTVILAKTSEDAVYHGALSDSVAWWKPTNIVLTKQYLADRHTFVCVVLSEEDEGCMAFIECAVF